MLRVNAIPNDECRKRHILPIYDSHLCTFTKLSEGICKVSGNGFVVHNLSKIRLVMVQFILFTCLGRLGWATYFKWWTCWHCEFRHIVCKRRSGCFYKSFFILWLDKNAYGELKLGQYIICICLGLGIFEKICHLSDFYFFETFRFNKIFTKNKTMIEKRNEFATIFNILE